MIKSRPQRLSTVEPCSLMFLVILIQLIGLSL
jgi:hypothetical protein